jgi:para-nitrobenzyl esterase
VSSLLSACAAMAWVFGPLGVAPAAAPEVRIDSGRIRGTAEGGVAAYLGIPYAAPPVGSLRWEPPQPVTPWSAVRPCTQFGPACPQPASPFGRDVGRQDEDCLYLNVWTAAEAPVSTLGGGSGEGEAHRPSPSSASATAGRPVMVWIHGGGCSIGAGSLPYYNGRRLAEQGVVLVTLNYRLGPLGFLAHPLLSKESPHGVSGNYGLLDQIEALRWVQRNIAAFGGDPQRVTVFGESAGALCIARLMVSPPAKGLFQRAIAQSGAAHGRNRDLKKTVGRMESMEAIGERLAKALGCDRAADPLAALRAKTPAELLAAAQPQVGLFGAGTHFGPVVDGWVLPDNAVRLFQQGRQHDVPLMVGTNADEGSIFLRQLPVQRTVAYRLLVRRLFPERADEVLTLFPAANDAEVEGALNRLVTVVSFEMPARFLAKSMAPKKSKAYLYQFTRVPPFGARPPAEAGGDTRGAGGGLQTFGAFHGLEIAYVFGNPLVGAGRDPIDQALSKAMMDRWIRFAATGDPNPPRASPVWPAYDPAGDQYLEFGDVLAVKTGLHKSACDLFERLAVDLSPAGG